MTAPDLAALAPQWGLGPQTADNPLLRRLADVMLVLLDEIPEAAGPAPRAAVREVAAVGPDPFNALVRRCRVLAEEPADGRLRGLRLAVKDSIAVAGVPLTLGSALIRDLVPDEDATVTDRVLAAGAEIAGIANMDALAYTGGGHTSATGPILNPFDAARTAGGSSGGSAAALWMDGFDAALGTDQAGSVRVPAAWCGVLGHKPTHGAVPYDGAVGIDAAVDHVGPLARDTAPLAALLDVLTGREDATRAVAGAPDQLGGVRLGVVATDPDATDPAVRAQTDATLATLEALGATTTAVSIPELATAGAVGFGIVIEGLAAGLGGAGATWPALARALADGFERRADAVPDEVMLGLLLGSHLRDRRRGETYARAQRARRALRRGHDRALDGLDALVLPTTPSLPMRHADRDPYERLMDGWNALANTSATNLTGHPALSLPTGVADGLPVGTMLVGRHGEDARLLGLARTYERAVGWPVRYQSASAT